MGVEHSFRYITGRGCPNGLHVSLSRVMRDVGFRGHTLSLAPERVPGHRVSVGRIELSEEAEVVEGTICCLDGVEMHIIRTRKKEDH